MNDFFGSILQVLGASAGAAFLIQVVLPSLARRKGVTIAALQTIISVAEKAVMAIEQASANLSPAEKKAKAREMIRQILAGMKIAAPDALIDTAIEAAVLLMNALTKRRPS